MHEKNMMTTILARDKTGKTTVGDAVFHIPQDVSALSVAGTNAICNGDRFENDFWVYGPDGKRRRKWFKTISHKTKGVIWPPKLNDVATLEAKRWKWQHRMAKQFLPEWHKICARLRKLGNVGGYLNNGPKAKGWVQFEIHADGGVSWHWCRHHDKGKPDVINQEFVDWYFDHERRFGTANGRYYMIREAFLKAVEHNFWENFSKNDTTLHLQVNGRDYWFCRPRSKYSDGFFEVLAFPEDTSVVKVEK